jgi:hypothetical protein
MIVERAKFLLYHVIDHYIYKARCTLSDLLKLNRCRRGAISCHVIPPWRWPPLAAFLQRDVGWLPWPVGTPGQQTRQCHTFQRHATTSPCPKRPMPAYAAWHATPPGCTPLALLLRPPRVTCRARPACPRRPCGRACCRKMRMGAC